MRIARNGEHGGTAKTNLEEGEGALVVTGAVNGVRAVNAQRLVVAAADLVLVCGQANTHTNSENSATANTGDS